MSHYGQTQRPRWATEIFIGSHGDPAPRWSGAKLDVRGQTNRLRAKSSVFASGQPAGFVYQVRKGTVGLTSLQPNGRRQVIGFAFPGDWLGVQQSGKFLHDAECLSPVDLYCVPRQDLGDLTRQDRDLRAALSGMPADLTASLLTHLTLLSRRDANARLASFVMLMAERAPRIVVDEAEAVELQMRREDIADYVNLATESVGRALAALEAAHLVSFLNPRLFRVLNIQGLAKVANDDR